MTPKTEDEAFVATLLSAVPELTRSYEEHLRDNDELLPYVYLPDAVRELEHLMLHDRLNADTCQRFAQITEEGLLRGGRVRNLTLIGIIEELASLHKQARDRDRRDLLHIMGGVLGARTREAIKEECAADPFLRIRTKGQLKNPRPRGRIALACGSSAA